MKPIPKASQAPFPALAACTGLIAACAWDSPCTGAAGSPPLPQSTNKSCVRSSPRFWRGQNFICKGKAGKVEWQSGAWACQARCASDLQLICWGAPLGGRSSIFIEGAWYAGCMQSRPKRHQGHINITAWSLRGFSVFSCSLSFWFYWVIIGNFLPVKPGVFCGVGRESPSSGHWRGTGLCRRTISLQQQRHPLKWLQTPKLWPLVDVQWFERSLLVPSVKRRLSRFFLQLMIAWA